MESENVMRFVSLANVARVLTTTPADMADVLRSEKFDDASKAAFADFILSTQQESKP
jgi:hypothetical protein